MHLMYANTDEGQKMAFNPLELKLQLLRAAMWVLETELKSSIWALNPYSDN